MFIALLIALLIVAILAGRAWAKDMGWLPRPTHFVRVEPLPNVPVSYISDCCNASPLRLMNPNRTGQCGKCQRMAIFHPCVECSCEVHA